MLPGSPHGNADGLVERIVEALLRRILHGDFAPNERLRQDDLAREFAVSQGTMREAFRKLEAQRLLESLPRRGVRVTALDAATEREVAAMRGALEVLAVRSIARPPGKDHLKFLESVLRRGDAAQDLFESEAANREFHVGLAKPCGMPRLIASIAELNLAYSRHVFASRERGPWKPRYNFDHWRIFEAYAAANLEQAGALLARHVNAVDRVNPLRGAR